MRLVALGLFLAGLLSGPAFAQSPALATVVTTCGTLTTPYTAGTQRPITVDVNGNYCGNTSGGGASAVTTTPGPRTIVALTVSTVTTGGTAVTALTAGQRTAGGFLQNPIGATINLCINERGTASGTTSSGDTTCIQPGQAYVLSPSAAAVSVITSDSSHPFSGYGLQ